MKVGLVPDTVVVPGSGIEDAAPALSSDPRPWFSVPLLKDGSIGAVAFMNIGFVPGGEALITLRHLMGCVGRPGGELGAAMGFEDTSDQFDEGLGFPVARRS